ncbi:MAG: SGNH/GDSL hydrolase family protein [Myxococcales bacterium]|nr:SGNH/GDSL hydrolase family protein [Myxococcales bacterium]
MHKWWGAWALVWSASGCAPDRGDFDTATVYAVGDSILEWNLRGGDSIPQVAAAELTRGAYNAAVSGARVLGDPPTIDEQYETKDWDWVIVNGGGNDLNEDCDCDGCDDVLDDLVTADTGFGDQVDLVERIQADGAQVVILGYYELPSFDDVDEDGPFAKCADELATLSQRQQGLASRLDGVWFADGRNAVRSSDDALFDNDQLHPSRAGSQRLGELVASVIGEAGTEFARP